MSKTKKTKTEIRKENRERQQKYRSRQKQLGLKQVNLFVNLNKITSYEKTVRELSQTLMNNQQPSPKRTELQELADLLKLKKSCSLAPQAERDCAILTASPFKKT